MKITDMKVHMMQVPLVRPFRISLGVITHAVSCLVEIETDAGITGYGEGSPGPLITGENLPGTVETLRVFREKLIGMDPRDIEGINAIPGLHPDGFSHHRLLPHGWPLLWQYRLRYSFQPWSLSHGSLQPHAPLRQQP